MSSAATDHPRTPRSGPAAAGTEAAASAPGMLVAPATAHQPDSPGLATPVGYQGPPQKRLVDPGGSLRGLGLNLVLTVAAFLLFLPFVWMVLTSVKSLSEVGMGSWVPGEAGWRWGNYLEVFERIPFARFYWNSLYVAACVTFLQVITSAMAAFAFSRLRWRGRDAVFLLYLATMMLPGLVLMVPNFQVMITLGLVDTLPGLILPAAFSAFGTFLLRQFMLGIPKAIDEAASIDGASRWRLFWDIILPLARPGLVTLAIFTFMQSYNSFFWPLVMLRSEYRLTLPVGLLSFDTSSGQQTNLLMAAVTMSVVPMVVVFVLLQKQLVKGIQLGAVKG